MLLSGEQRRIFSARDVEHLREGQGRRGGLRRRSLRPCYAGCQTDKQHQSGSENPELHEEFQDRLSTIGSTNRKDNQISRTSSGGEAGGSRGPETNRQLVSRST